MKHKFIFKMRGEGGTGLANIKPSELEMYTEAIIRTGYNFVILKRPLLCPAIESVKDWYSLHVTNTTTIEELRNLYQVVRKIEEENKSPCKQ